LAFFLSAAKKQTQLASYAAGFVSTVTELVEAWLLSIVEAYFIVSGMDSMSTPSVKLIELLETKKGGLIYSLFQFS